MPHMEPDELIELIARYGDAERHQGTATDPQRIHEWDQRANRLFAEISRAVDPKLDPANRA